MNNYITQIQTKLKQAGFYTGEIDGIAGRLTVQAVERAVGGQTPLSPLKVWQLSDKGLELIKQFEGFRSAPYKDAVGVWTIGYGNTYYPSGKKVTANDTPLSRQQAHDLKLTIINQDFAPKVRELIDGLPINQNQFDALVSLAYNIGVGALAKSSVIRHLKQGNIKASADAFLLYNKAGGRVLAGLDRRRKAERAWFLA